jgi:hypothetical protein
LFFEERERENRYVFLAEILRFRARAALLPGQNKRKKAQNPPEVDRKDVPNFTLVSGRFVVFLWDIPRD